MVKLNDFNSGDSDVVANVELVSCGLKTELTIFLSCCEEFALEPGCSWQMSLESLQKHQHIFLFLSHQIWKYLIFALLCALVDSVETGKEKKLKNLSYHQYVKKKSRIQPRLSLSKLRLIS